jgi:hypothetical protein
MNKIERTTWNTTFDKELRKEVAKTAIDLNTTPNMVLEIAYIYLKQNLDIEKAKKIIEERKTALRAK